MPLYKRIQQLGETTVSMPDDYLALDKEGSTETNKIRKRDFLQGYLQEPDLEQAYPTKAWARRGGTWIEIFPDEYVLEANVDGRIYARSDGDWVVIGEDGLSGDMYAARYDQRNHGTDIFDIIQKQLKHPNWLGQTLVNGQSLMVGNFLNGELIFNEAVQAVHYTDMPDSNRLLNSVEVYLSKNDVFANKSFAYGNYSKKAIDGETPIGERKMDVLHSVFCVPVSNGKILKIKNLSNQAVKIKFIETDQTNGYIQDLNVTAAGNEKNEIQFYGEQEITFTKNCCVGFEISFGEIEENGDFLASDTMPLDWKIAYDRYKLPLLASLDNEIIIKEITVAKYSNLEQPVQLDLLKGTFQSFLDQFVIPYESWTFENNADGYIIAKAELPIQNIKEVFIEDYPVTESIGLLNGLSHSIKEEEGKKYIYIVTNYSNSEAKNFSLQCFYKKETKGNFDPINIPDGSFQIVARSVYDNSEYCYGQLVFKQNAFLDYFLRKSGGEISGNLSVVGDIIGKSNLKVDHIKSLNGANTIDLNNGIQAHSSNAFGVSATEVNMDSESSINLNGKDLNFDGDNVKIQSASRPTINEDDILTENDFVVNASNTPGGKNWAPQVKTNAYGDSKNIVNEEYLNNYFPPRDGRKLLDNNEDNLIKNYQMQNIKGTNFSISQQLILPDESPSHAAIINENKKLVSSEITTEELNTLAGINTDRTIQNQLDAIPKYKYLDGQTVIITDEQLKVYLKGVAIEDATQEQIDTAMVDLGRDKLNNGSLFDKSYQPTQWDAIGLRLERSEKEIFKDAMYYYDSINRWIFLYFLSTTVSRADGTIAGIVENSSDITWANGLGTVKHSQTADRLTPGRNINGTKFDGSADIITAKWGTARTIGVTGELSGSASIDGSKNVNIDVSYVVHEIPQNTDLNTYKSESQVGFYKVSTTRVAETIKNKPVGEAFGLEIMSTGAGIRQEFTTFGQVRPRKWFRTYYTYNQAWSKWFEIFTESSNPTFYKINNNLPDANHELDLTTEKTFGPEEEITLKGSGERIQSVTALGFTQQAGRGDPSPTNVRAITNGGLRMVKVVFDGTENWVPAISTSGADPAFAIENVPVPKSGTNENIAIKTQFCTDCPIRNSGGYSGECIWVYGTGSASGIRARLFRARSAKELKKVLADRYAAGNPVIVWYVPADEADATGLYAPIILTSGEYRATCLPLTAPLCDGDSVVSWVKSGCDKVVTFDGTQTPISTTALNSVYRIAFSLPTPAISTKTQYTDQFPAQENYTTENEHFYALSNLYVFVSKTKLSGGTNENAKQYFAANPLTVWYRSTNYTPAADIPVSRETHQRAVLALDGTEAFSLAASSANLFQTYSLVNDKNFTAVCDRYKNGGNQWTSMPDFSVLNSGTILGFRDSRFSTAENFKAYLAAQHAAGTPVTIVYQLATPITYAHPAVELRAYEDSNNSYTISAQENATVSVTLKPMQAADTLDGFHAKDFMPNTITIIRGRVY